MAWWAVAAPIIGAAIDAISGRSQQNRAPRLAGRTAYNENYQGMLGRLEAARASGIHPALALGASIGSSGAPSMVGSDFTSAFMNGANEFTRQREWKQEQEFRRAQEAEKSKREAAEQRLEEAQISHIQKQNEFIDEQIRASQEQRVREANRQQVTTVSGPHDMVSVGSGRRGSYVADNVGKNVVYVPNEVVRSVNGQAQGDNPGYEYIIMNGRRVRVPFGTTQNSETSEAWNTYRDFSTAIGPDGALDWRRPVQWIKEAFAPGSPAHRQIREWMRKHNKRDTQYYRTSPSTR